MTAEHYDLTFAVGRDEAAGIPTLPPQISEDHFAYTR